MALIAATVLMACTAIIHAFVGTRTDLAPLLRSDVPEPARSTLYFCWHIISILLFAMTAALALASTQRDYILLAKAVFVLATLFAIWGFVAAALRRKSPFTQLPQGMMFAAIAALSGWGIFA